MSRHPWRERVDPVARYRAVPPPVRNAALLTLLAMLPFLVLGLHLVASVAGVAGAGVVLALWLRTGR